VSVMAARIGPVAAGNGDFGRCAGCSAEGLCGHDPLR